MEFIRSEKVKVDYDPNTRHCLYGLDADLVSDQLLVIMTTSIHIQKSQLCIIKYKYPMFWPLWDKNIEETSLWPKKNKK